MGENLINFPVRGDRKIFIEYFPWRKIRDFSVNGEISKNVIAKVAAQPRNEAIS